MPTPIYHLAIAQDLLSGTGLTSTAREFLRACTPAFLLGNTAPDIRVVSHHERYETHFYDLPLNRAAEPPWEKMLRLHPGLWPKSILDPDHAAFIIGYLCHLQADWQWVKDVYAPYFSINDGQTESRQGVFLHDVLRSYMDRPELASLPEDIGPQVGQAEPHGWHPFVADADLMRWRDYLAHNVTSEAVKLTVKVFARRQGIPVETFFEMMDSEDAMEQHIFSLMPRSLLVDYRNRLLQANRTLLNAFVAGEPA